MSCKLQPVKIGRNQSYCWKPGAETLVIAVLRRNGRQQKQRAGSYTHSKSKLQKAREDHSAFLGNEAGHYCANSWQWQVDNSTHNPVLTPRVKLGQQPVVIEHRTAMYDPNFAWFSECWQTAEVECACGNSEISAKPQRPDALCSTHDSHFVRSGSELTSLSLSLSLLRFVFVATIA